jgi:hypothetical protein
MTFHSNTSSVSLSLSSTVTSTTLFPLSHSVSSPHSMPPAVSQPSDIQPVPTVPDAVWMNVDTNEKETELVLSCHLFPASALIFALESRFLPSR